MEYTNARLLAANKIVSYVIGASDAIGPYLPGANNKETQLDNEDNNLTSIIVQGYDTNAKVFVQLQSFYVAPEYYIIFKLYFYLVTPSGSPKPLPQLILTLNDLIDHTIYGRLMEIGGIGTEILINPIPNSACFRIMARTMDYAFIWTILYNPTNASYIIINQIIYEMIAPLVLSNVGNPGIWDQINDRVILSAIAHTSPLEFTVCVLVFENVSAQQPYPNISTVVITQLNIPALFGLIKLYNHFIPNRFILLTASPNYFYYPDYEKYYNVSFIQLESNMQVSLINNKTFSAIYMEKINDSSIWLVDTNSTISSFQIMPSNLVFQKLIITRLDAELVVYKFISMPNLKAVIVFLSSQISGILTYYRINTSTYNVKKINTTISSPNYITYIASDNIWIYDASNILLYIPENPITKESSLLISGVTDETSITNWGGITLASTNVAKSSLAIRNTVYNAKDATKNIKIGSIVYSNMVVAKFSTLIGQLTTDPKGNLRVGTVISKDKIKLTTF